MNEVRALRVAMMAHKGQKDKAGVDYIYHPIAVAKLVEGKEEKIVALLHDVVEDTHVKLSDLKARGFSQRVLDAVDAITHREGEPRFEYLARVKANPIALTVKFADIKHNMSPERQSKLPRQMQAKLEKKYKENLEFLEK